MNAWSKALLSLLIVSCTNSQAFAQGAQVVEYVGGQATSYTAPQQAAVSDQIQSTNVQLESAEFDEPKYVVDLGQIVSPMTVQPMCIRPSANSARIQEFGSLKALKNGSLAHKSVPATIANRTSTEKPSRVALGNAAAGQ